MFYYSSICDITQYWREDFVVHGYNIKDSQRSFWEKF